MALPAAAQQCVPLADIPRYNTNPRDDRVIVLGTLPGRPYLVLIPGGDPNTLADIRTCVADAFVSESRLGSYIHLGTFAQRADAEAAVAALRQAGYPARMVHRRGIVSFD